MPDLDTSDDDPVEPLRRRARVESILPFLTGGDRNERVLLEAVAVLICDLRAVGYDVREALDMAEPKLRVIEAAVPVPGRLVDDDGEGEA